MKTLYKTQTVLFCLFLLFMGTAAQTQEFSDEMQISRKTPPVSSLCWEAKKIDRNSPFSGMPAYTPESNTHKQSRGGWFPIKGEVYYMTDENEVEGHLYHEINPEGFIESRIVLGIEGGPLYDSTYSVLNSTPYARERNWIDTTYNYNRNPDGTYTPDLKRVFSYHYLDHFEGDSCFYEIILYQWNASTNQWDNWTRQKTGYHNSITEAENRTVAYSGSGNEWFLTARIYDSMPCNSYNAVDTVYKIRNHSSYNSKVAFTYDDPEAGYTQRELFVYQNGHWVSNSFYYDYEWTEWNGFTYTSNIYIGPAPVTPYKISKVKSYKMWFPDGRNYYYEKWWDVGDTKNTYDTLYQFLNDGTRYPFDTEAYIYNEYGDLVEYRGIMYNEPDENGNQTVNNGLIYLMPYTYDSIYGLIEEKSYVVQVGEDTQFMSRIKYTDFVYLSVPENESLPNQPLIITPNPAASGKVSISAAATIKLLQVFDSNGKLLNRLTPESNKVTFDTERLSKGIYIVQAILKNGSVQAGKIVVN